MTSTSICPSCGGEMRRCKRPLFHRFKYSATYRCRNCTRYERISRLEALKVSRFARCPECQSFRLRVLKRRDFIDRYNRNPFRLLQLFVKARLYHCSGCRLQFYDARDLRR